MVHSKSQRRLCAANTSDLNPTALPRVRSSEGGFEPSASTESFEALRAHTSTLGSMPLRVVGGLGAGGYACVVKAVHTETGEAFALKVIAKGACKKKRDRVRLQTEVEAMTEVGACPYLAKLHLAFESESALFLVCDLVGGGDLFGHLIDRIERTGRGFTEAEGRAVLAEVVLGVEHM